MRARIRCPFHNERTASLVRRKHDFYCYGSCSKAYTIQEVAEKGIALDYEEDYDREEDIEEKLTYIKSLPLRPQRGLAFPTDERGYFILWHDGTFYKYRRFNPGTGPKYLAPKGHYIPLFWARKNSNQTLAIVEGEINALSIAKAVETWDVCSVGSATKFNLETLSRYLPEFSRYSRVVVVLDDDAAGQKALNKVKAFFLYKIPFVNYLLLSPDANEILVEKGEKVLREKLQGNNFR